MLYGCEFQSIFVFNFLISTQLRAVTDALFNHSCVLLVCHGLDTVATITLNDFELHPKPNNMFVRYRYDVKSKLIKVFFPFIFVSI